MLVNNAITLKEKMCKSVMYSKVRNMVSQSKWKNKTGRQENIPGTILLSKGLAGLYHHLAQSKSTVNRRVKARPFP